MAPAPGPGILRPMALILLPYNDLNIDQPAEQAFDIIPEFRLGIVLPYGMGPTEPKVFQMDAAGNLRVASTGSSWVNVSMDGQAANTARPLSSAAALGDVANPLIVLGVENYLFDGVNPRQGRSASAANAAAQSGAGVGLVSGPGEWTQNAAPAAGVAASTVKAAGAAGVRHIGQSITFTMSSQAALAGVATVVLNVRDGASGAGTLLEQYNIDLPAAIVAPFSLILTDLNLVGSPATAMTVEMAAAVAGLRGSVTLRGYDAA